MSKSAALLLAVALGAGACSTTEPPQTIVAVVPASETGDVRDDSTAESTTTSSLAADEPSATAAETTAPEGATESTDQPSPVLSFSAPPSTAPASSAPASIAPTAGSLAEILAGSVADNQAISARFEGGIEISGSVEGQSIDMEMGIAGAFDSATNSMEMTVDMSSIADILGMELSDADAEMFGTLFSEPLEARSIGDTAWVKWGLLDMLTGSEGKWVEMEVEEADFAAGGVSPIDLLDVLDGVDGEITNVGPDTIAGVATTHYSIAVDLNSLGDLIDAQDAAEFAELAEFYEAYESVPVEIWIDADGRLRRLEMTLASDSFTALLGPSESMGMSIWYEISQYGSDVTIVAPPADQIISGDSLGLF